MKDWWQGGWMHEPIRGLCYWRPQQLEEGMEAPPPDIVIPDKAYYHLKEWLKEHEHHIVKTDRTEDLKIIHRLLDIMRDGLI